MPIRITILDDHQIVIDGLKLLLSDIKEFAIVAEFTNGLDLLDNLTNLKTDILLTDIMMPKIDGCEVALRVHKNFPEIKVVALSMNGEGALIHQMIENASVAGYLLKTIGKKELTDAIKAVYDGETYFSKEILEEYRTFQKIKKENDSINLTSRELEIIKCINDDLTNKQIADKLFISERTVETHRKNIFRKTGMHSVISLIEFCKKRKII